MTTTLTLEELEQSGERELGTSDWHEITQEQINLFADATGDHQWIHVDPEARGGRPVRHHRRARLPDALDAADAAQRGRLGERRGDGRQLRHGEDPLHEPRAVGSRVRLHAKLLRSERRGPSVIWNVGVQVEIEGKEKPALVGEVVYMAAGAPDA